MKQDFIAWVVGAIVILVGFLLYRNRDRHYPFPERLAVIKNALECGQDIWMIYFTFQSKRFSERTLTPLKIEQGIYLLALDHHLGKNRTFKISRIKELREIPRSKPD